MRLIPRMKMTRKHILIFSGIALFCILAAYITYQKVGKFLPTSAHALSFPVALDDQKIQQIRNATPIDSIQVYKDQRYLELKHQDQVIRRYPIRLGFAPLGHKVQEGDGKTPEGSYVIDWRNPQSAFYKSLHISYPNAADQQKAAQLGVSAGGDIMIHGSATSLQMKAAPQLKTYFPQKDWTWGCIAVRNIDMDEIWQLVTNHTAIHIHP